MKGQSPSTIEELQTARRRLGLSQPVSNYEPLLQDCERWESNKAKIYRIKNGVNTVTHSYKISEAKQKQEIRLIVLKPHDNGKVKIGSLPNAI